MYNWQELNESFFNDIEDDILNNEVTYDDAKDIYELKSKNCVTNEQKYQYILLNSYIYEFLSIIIKLFKKLVRETKKLENKPQKDISYNKEAIKNIVNNSIDLLCNQYDTIKSEYYGNHCIALKFQTTDNKKIYIYINIETYTDQYQGIMIDGYDMNNIFVCLQYINNPGYYFNQFKTHLKSIIKNPNNTIHKIFLS